MKKLLLTLMLAVVSGSAIAEWVEVGSNTHGFGDEFVYTAYADPTSIHKVDDIVKMRILMDYKPVEIVEMVDGKQQKLVIGKAESVESQGEFDCKKAQSRSISHEWAVDSPDSIVLISYDWTPVTPDSIDEKLWKYACGK